MELQKDYYTFPGFCETPVFPKDTFRFESRPCCCKSNPDRRPTFVKMTVPSSTREINVKTIMFSLLLRLIWAISWISNILSLFTHLGRAMFPSYFGKIMVIPDICWCLFYAKTTSNIKARVLRQKWSANIWLTINTLRKQISVRRPELNPCFSEASCQLTCSWKLIHGNSLKIHLCLTICCGADVSQEQ